MPNDKGDISSRHGNASVSRQTAMGLGTLAAVLLRLHCFQTRHLDALAGGSIIIWLMILYKLLRCFPPNYNHNFFKFWDSY